MRKSKFLSLSVFFAALFLVLSMHTFSVRTEAADLYSYTVKVDSGYLALRNAQAYDYNNEIGKLYSGSTVQVYDYNMTSGTYWWVYAPSLGMSGYVNRNYLVNGTRIQDNSSSQNDVIGSNMRVQVSSGYLALRNAKAYDYNNEIGKLYTGDIVTVLGTSDATYWWVYVPATGKYGYVNKNYLVATGERASGTTMTVKVDSGYLALRNAQAYDYNNEIGKLYTGDTVEVITKGGTYWWVYSAKLGKYGYVNSNYLVGSGGSSGGSSTPSSYGTYQVKVSSGYLALRNAKAYDYYNEIGQLYTGETVEVIDKSDAQYWWVYSNKLGKYGYVNKDYLVYVGSGSSQQSSSTTSTWTVHVDSGYLALRNAQAFDYSNEIGKLYNGDVVYVDSSNLTNGTYWWVYAPSLGKSGYVNRNYLY